MGVAAVVGTGTFFDSSGGEFGDRGSPPRLLGFAAAAPHRGVPDIEVLVTFACDERVRRLVSQRGQDEELLEQGVAGAGLPFVNCRFLRPTCNVDARARTDPQRRVRG